MNKCTLLTKVKNDWNERRMWDHVITVTQQGWSSSWASVQQLTSCVAKSHRSLGMSGVCLHFPNSQSTTTFERSSKYQTNTFLWPKTNWVSFKERDCLFHWGQLMIIQRHYCLTNLFLDWPSVLLHPFSVVAAIVSHCWIVHLFP